VVMDNAGQSLFMGGSIHIENLRPPDQDEEDEEEVQLQQEREAEIQEMLVDAFDDIEESESFANASSQYSMASNNVRHTPQQEFPDTPRSNNRSQVYAYGYTKDLYSRKTDEVASYSGVQYDLEKEYSQHDGCTPWSDESNSCRYSPVAVKDPIEEDHLTDQEEVDNINGQSHYLPNGLNFKKHMHDPYLADKYNNGVIFDDCFEGTVSTDKYQAPETSYDQLKLLYEARGRELDKMVEELSKVKSDNIRSVRVLQHKINLLISEKESKEISLKHSQVLVTERDALIKKMQEDLNELQKKNHANEESMKKLQLELESSDSTISSLECQITQLKSADSLARNQQLHDDFVKKLRQGNEAERELLLRKIQLAEQGSASHQEEAKTLREQLKTLRREYDEVLLQKMEAVTKLTIAGQQLQKQYEDLLQSHGSQKTLEMQLRIKCLENEKGNLEKTNKTLESELKTAREELKGLEIALKYDIFRDASTSENSLVQLGIKKVLNYDDTVSKESDVSEKAVSATQALTKMREELKKSIMANKMKRDEIARLHEDLRKKQDLLKKCQSDLKSSRVEIEELKESVLMLKLGKMEGQIQEVTNNQEPYVNVKKVQAENIALKEELLLLQTSFKNVKHLSRELSVLLEDLKKNISNLHTADKPNDFKSIFTSILQCISELNDKMLSAEKYQQVILQMRGEIQKLYKESNMWEKRLHDIEVKLTVSLQMIETAKGNANAENEYIRAQGVLKQLYTDIKLQVQLIKENTFTVNESNVALQEQLTSLKLEVEREKEKNFTLMQEKIALQADLVLLAEKKDQENSLALQNCQDTYLKFHENVVKELQEGFDAEYEGIGLKLKMEISRLAEELTKVKSLYNELSEERNSLAMRLNAVNKDNAREHETQENRDLCSHLECKCKIKELENQIIDKNCILEKLQKEVESGRKEIQVIEKDLENEKNLRQNDVKRLFAEREDKANLHKQCQEMVKNYEELQQKCLELEESNQNIKEKLANDSTTSLLTKIQGVLMTKEGDTEKMNEVKQQLEFEICNLKQNILVLEGKRSDDVKSFKSLKRTNEELMEQILSLTKAAEVRELEREEDIKKSSDMVLKLEVELEDQREKATSSKRAYDKTMQNLMPTIRSLESRLEAAHTENKGIKTEFNILNKKYKEVKTKCDEIYSKYENLKIKLFKKRKCILIKSERLDQRLKALREHVTNRVKEYFDTLKRNDKDCMEKIIAILSECCDAQPDTEEIIKLLDQIDIKLK
ncbi:hypothetical protein SK128_014349, partial [Halocaridina rubra]